MDRQECDVRRGWNAQGEGLTLVRGCECGGWESLVQSKIWWEGRGAMLLIGTIGAWNGGGWPSNRRRSLWKRGA